MMLLAVGSFQEAVGEFAGGAAQMFLVFGAVFALLNCFLGYKLVKLWSALAGFAVGGLAGFAVAMHFWNNAGIGTVVAIVAGLALGAVAFFIYKAGVFVFCAFLTLFFCGAFIPGWPGAVIGLVLGIVVGVLAMKFMREVLIVTSAFSGGMNAANSLLPIFSVTAAPAIWIVGILLAAAGIFVQWRTTGGKNSSL